MFRCSQKVPLRFQHRLSTIVPAGVHRCNAAECCICTFKSHFIAGLCSVNKDFPLHLWDKLVPQAELSLNLMRGSRLNPKLSVHAQMDGQFEFNRTPMAPPGIRVLVHDKPDKRTTWSPQALDGWNLGPALDAYRCYTVWIWETRTSRSCDTLSWFPTKVTMLLASSTDLIVAGIHDIVAALNNPSPGSALAPLSDSQVTALRQLTTILTNVLPSTPKPISEPTCLDTAPLLPTSPNNIVTKEPTAPLRVQPPAPRKVDKPPMLRPSLRLETNSPIPAPTVPFVSVHSQLPMLPIHSPTVPVLLARNDAAPSAAPNSHHCLPKTIHPTTLLCQLLPINKRKPKQTTKQSTVRKAPRRRSNHHYGTRSNPNPLQHVAASAAALLSTPDPASPPFTHSAFHGNAFNPDTGKLAEFLELSKCSEGASWQ
jgi:hypothetical protein